MDIITFDSMEFIGKSQKVYALVIGEVVTPDDRTFYKAIAFHPKDFIGQTVIIGESKIISKIRNNDWVPYMMIKEYKEFDILNIIFINKKEKKIIFNRKIIEYDKFDFKSVVQITEHNYKFINFLRKNVYNEVKMVNMPNTPKKIPDALDLKFYEDFEKGIDFLYFNHLYILNPDFVFVQVKNKDKEIVMDIISRVDSTEKYEVAFGGNSPFSKMILSYKKLSTSFGKDFAEMTIDNMKEKSSGLEEVVHMKWEF